MKKVLLVLALGLIFGCGGSDQQGFNGGGIQASGPSCSGDYLGTWTSKQGSITLNSNCTGSESSCASQFTYSVNGSSASLNIFQANSGCATGSFNCAFLVTGNSLVVNCGGGAVTYSK